tara:strand:+ start:298 stop:435 length:138 start_codon:yes stop_codon:yes gene_type:complete
MISGIRNLWQRYKEWRIIKQSEKFAKELHDKEYKPREKWSNGVWK